MKIDFDGIQAFVMIAELGGFNRAAESLHLTQTALTRRMQKLESYLGLKLLDRTTRHVELTAVGRDFLPQARNIELDHLRERLGEIDRERPVVVFCQVGLRGYLAYRILRQAGFKDVRNLTGGFKTYAFATEKQANPDLFDYESIRRRSAAEIELLSINPEHPVRRLELAEVEWVARIVWASQ